MTEAVSPVSTLQRIQDLYPEMTKAEKKIADYVLAHPTNITRETISEITRHTGVKSEASVVRFYRLLGFSGFHDFKLCMAQELVGNTFYHNYDDIQTTDSFETIWNKIHSGVISTLQANAQQANADVLFKACEAIRLSNRIIFLGYAASAALCYYAYFRFLELGYNCHFSSDPHINAALLTQPNPNDLIFCISNSGETKDLIFLLESLPRDSVKILAITGNNDSTLAKMADIAIETKGEEDNIITDALNSRSAQMCTIDALFSMVGISKGEDAFKRLLNTRKTFYRYKK